jgi:Na+/proline symporter
MSYVFFWIITLLFFAVLIGIGIRENRRIKAISDSEERAFDFWSGEVRYKGWWLAASLAAGWMLIGWMTWQMILWYWYGVGAFWLFTLPWIGCATGLLFMPRISRRFPGISIPEILRLRYGKLIQPILGPVQAFVYLTWLAAEIYVLGAVMSAFLGISIEAAAIMISIVFGAYVILGGFGSVLKTDLIQFALCTILLITLAIAGLSVAAEKAGGLQNIFALIDENPPIYTEGTFFDWDSPGIPLIVLTIIAYLPGWITLQGAWQRIQAAENIREAQKGMWWNLLFNVFIVVLLPTLIAISTLVIFPPINGEVPPEVGDYGYFIFSSLITHLFSSPVIQAFLMICLIGMALSSVDTYVNVCAMNICNDVLEPLVYEKRNVSGETKLFINQVMVGIFILLALGWVFVFPGLWDMYYISSALVTVAVSIVVFSLFYKKTTSLAAYLTTILGTVGIFGFYVLERLQLMTWQPEWLAQTGISYAFWGILLALIGFIVGQLVGEKPSKEALAIYEQQYYSGRSEMFSLRKKLKGQQ